MAARWLPKDPIWGLIWLQKANIASRCASDGSKSKILKTIGLKLARTSTTTALSRQQHQQQHQLQHEEQHQAQHQQQHRHYHHHYPSSTNNNNTLRAPIMVRGTSRPRPGGNGATMCYCRFPNHLRFHSNPVLQSSYHYLIVLPWHRNVA